MALRLGTIELAPDMRWSDEFRWLPTASQVDVASDGALWVEETARRAGRPITLESGTDNAGHWGVASRATIEALHALASTPRQAPLVLELEDGRTFDVRFRHADSAIEAEPITHIAPHIGSDQYHLTLRLMQV